MKVDVIFKDTSVEEAKKLILCAEELSKTEDKQYELPLAVPTDFVADTTAVVENVPEEDVCDIDVEGLPWDGRIHSSNQKKTAKGVWQRRRGVTDEEYENVKAEILGLHAAPAMPQAMPTPAMPAVPAAPAMPQAMPTPAVPAAPAMPQAMPTPAVPAAPAMPQAMPTPAMPAVPAAPAMPQAMPTPAVPAVPAAPAMPAVTKEDVRTRIQKGVQAKVIGVNDVQATLTISGHSDLMKALDDPNGLATLDGFLKSKGL